MPLDRIQGITTVAEQHQRAIGEIAHFPVFNAVQTFEQVSGHANAPVGAGVEVVQRRFGIDVQHGTIAVVALEGNEPRHAAPPVFMSKTDLEAGGLGVILNIR